MFIPDIAPSSGTDETNESTGSARLLVDNLEHEIRVLAAELAKVICESKSQSFEDAAVDSVVGKRIADVLVDMTASEMQPGEYLQFVSEFAGEVLWHLFDAADALGVEISRERMGRIAGFVEDVVFSDE
jgi:hypothetical protein